MKYYLRKNTWCECELSINHAEDEMEDGLSVYHCKNYGQGRWLGEGSDGLGYLYWAAGDVRVRLRCEGRGSAMSEGERVGTWRGGSWFRDSLKRTFIE